MSFVRFVGALTDHQRRHLDRNGVAYRDTSIPKVVSGLASLETGNVIGQPDSVAPDKIAQTQDQATDMFAHVHVIRPAKTPVSDIVAIVTKYHIQKIKTGDSNVSVLYDVDSDPYVDSMRKSDYERAIGSLRDIGMNVYLSLDELIENLDLKVTT